MRTSYAFIGAVFLGLSVQTHAWTLSIAHSNDMHEAYTGLDGEGKRCQEVACRPGLGGVMRMAAALAKLREKHPEMIYVDAGDHAGGARLHPEWSIRAEALVLNAMKPAAYVLGSAELSQGLKYPRYLASEVDAPLLAANIEGWDVPAKAGVIVRVNGRKVGITGLSATDTVPGSPMPASLRLADPAKAIEREAARLRSLGAEAVIAITHMGEKKDQELARRVRGVTAWVGGRTQQPRKGAPKAKTPYPLVATNPDGHRVPIVSAGENANSLGFLRLEIGQGGYATAFSGQALELTDELLIGLDARPQLSMYSAMRKILKGLRQ